MDFHLDVDSIKQSAKKSKEQAESKGSTNFPDHIKLDKEITKVVLLPSADGKSIVKEVYKHQLWKNHKPVASCYSTENYDEGQAGHGIKDAIKQFGWALREKFKDSDNEKLKDLFRTCMFATDRYVNCIDYDAPEKGVQLLKLPNLAYEALMDEILESSNEEIKDLLDPNTGRVFAIKHNGKEGLAKRYTVAKFSKKSANLVDNGKVKAEEINNQLCDLNRLVPAYNETKINEYLAEVKKQCKWVVKNEQGDDDLDLNDDNIDDEPMEMSNDDTGLDDFDLD